MHCARKAYELFIVKLLVVDTSASPYVEHNVTIQKPLARAHGVRARTRVRLLPHASYSGADAWGVLDALAHAPSQLAVCRRARLKRILQLPLRPAHQISNPRCEYTTFATKVACYLIHAYRTHSLLVSQRQIKNAQNASSKFLQNVAKEHPRWIPYYGGAAFT